MKHMNKRILLALGIGFSVGILWFMAIRFVTYKSDNVHYHANFALYVNGKREEFKSFTFYEEVQACASDADGNPKHRVHMHNQVNDLVHVHASVVTWGHLFANLGFTLGDSLLKTDEGVFIEGDKNNLTFILNGEKVDGIANKVIESEDRLLINYGNEDETLLKERFNNVAQTASEFNGKYDPGGCSGGEQLTFIQRLKKAAGLDNSASH